jgi:hypothetical protein
MVNKDQLEQTPEGHQVLVLMASNFTDEEFQPALTLIEQLYIEDQTVWDAGLNHEGKWPFVHTTPAHRLLIFFEHPDHLERIKGELQRRQIEHEANLVVPKPVRLVRKVQKPKKKATHRPRKKKPAKSTTHKVKGKKPGRPKARKPVRKASGQKKKSKKPVKARRR